jgi:hypothetical protein
MRTCRVCGLATMKWKYCDPCTHRVARERWKLKARGLAGEDAQLAGYRHLSDMAAERAREVLAQERAAAAQVAPA